MLHFCVTWSDAGCRGDGLSGGLPGATRGVQGGVISLDVSLGARTFADILIMCSLQQSCQKQILPQCAPLPCASLCLRCPRGWSQGLHPRDGIPGAAPQRLHPRGCRGSLPDGHKQPHSSGGVCPAVSQRSLHSGASSWPCSSSSTWGSCWDTLTVTATSLHQGLHTPAYFFLTIQAIVDTVRTSTVLPRLLETLVVKGGTTSCGGCLTQRFFLTWLLGAELLLLTATACDGYSL